ncbi:MAG: CAP domain-containing protein [Candidatus Saccharibacteria bacterium]
MMYAVFEADNQLPHQEIGLNQNKHYQKTLLKNVAGFIFKFRLLISAVLFCGIILSPQLSLLAQAPRNGTVNQSVNSTTVTRTSAENYYLKAINDLRISKELPVLVIDSRLSSSANQKGIDMSNSNYWGHYAPMGKSFADFIWQVSPNAETVGENLAKCYSSQQSAFEALIASPTHYAIMVGNFTNFGVSEVVDKNSGCINTIMHFAQYG